MGDDNIDLNKLNMLKFELLEALRESQKRDKSILSMLPSWAQLVIGILLIITPTVGSWYNMRLSIENLTNTITDINRKIEKIEKQNLTYSDFKISISKDLYFMSSDINHIKDEIKKLQSDISELKLKVNTLEKVH